MFEWREIWGCRQKRLSRALGSTQSMWCADDPESPPPPAPAGEQIEDQEEWGWDEQATVFREFMIGASLQQWEPTRCAQGHPQASILQQRPPVPQDIAQIQGLCVPQPPVPTHPTPRPMVGRKVNRERECLYLKKTAWCN